MQATGSMHMDGLNLLLTALATGAGAGVQQVAGSAIKDAYTGLKTLLQRKLAGQPAALTALTEYEADPDTYEKPLRKALATNHLDQDEEILQSARHLITLIQPQQAGQESNIVQNLAPVQGQVIENSGTITMHFGELPRT
jgi:hypothetical protein